MHASINWLKEYVNFTWTAEELAHRLTMAGIAIEGIEDVNNDKILALDLTPNRGDCLGIINLAREVAALSGSELLMPEINFTENNESIHDYVKVEITAPDLCPRYTARVIKNVKIKPSPEWMQTRLLSCGVRPINNVVDVTNYVMLECNQPLHAFDYDLLSNAKTILVRRAQPGEKITTLDGVDRNLNQEALLITDNGRPVALAGIMGGQNTEIGEQTINVLLESAYFQNIGIRKSSRMLGLRSDSSIRFEKGTDINGVIFAVNRAAALLQELGEAEVIRGVSDCYPHTLNHKHVLLRPARVNHVLGTSISSGQVKQYISSLKFDWEDQGGDLLVQVPSYRPDIDQEVDLIEEVARLHGYENIPAQLPWGITTQGGLTSFQKFRDNLSNFMIGSFYETVNYSFISDRFFEMMRLPKDSPLRNVVRLANPLSEEQSIMRTMLLPGLLDTLSRNLARKNSNLAFFELGSVFHPRLEAQPEEVLKVAAAVTGRQEAGWCKSEIEMDFYYLKGIVEKLFKILGITDVRWMVCKDPGYHPGRSAVITCQDKEIGTMGELHPLVLQNFDIKSRACAFELDVNRMFELSHLKVMMQGIPKYPAVERDLAIVIKEDINAADALIIIREAGGTLLQNVAIFDVYAGEQVAEGYKSIAFKMTFQAQDRTLTEAEVNNSLDEIRAQLELRVNASLR